MKLYDGISDINWHYEGFKSREEMNGDLRFPPVDKPCVLMDDANGKVYDWRYLSIMCKKYNVKFEEGLENYQQTYDTMIKAMNNQPPLPTLDSINKKTDENALAIAELGVTATQASNEQMLGMAEVGTMLADIMARLEKAGI